MECHKQFENVLLHECIFYRLVVVAEKRVVYKEFPIPLINRMEKHFLNMEGMLTDCQLRLSNKLELWAKEFSGASDRFEQMRYTSLKIYIFRRLIPN